ncbi:ribosome-associated translation inhibitor RaiA [Actinosynnema pretiosum subsp. pretiosum]|uniref:Ribosome hibernation promoting factor n=2 Tax=Actinosynnema TaxID=40566 RepID=C6WJ34_ACTMD|nr:ribosome-associated translation inhibitor RaiA [Actinosynnema mirum]ACU40110.1 sigma 54 modulation protein/ribosomal protein S30EA [Actinosynnema mirum DSM 43827]AXX33638.1 Ribosomal subunit interface protein [Actinosynnema pretiosum subsp. pretiosum]QUF02575.1 ribosome-associated translation inhibitor RaiA [Actinosynnema pretiosum subsp. pretiosum]
MDIVVKGRNVEVPEHYRVHVAEKLARLERYDRKVIRFDVELFHEPNRRQSKNCQRVEITGKGRGPVIRAEASAGDFYAALDTAVAKLESRLRRTHDRRRVHYGRRGTTSVAEATGGLADVLVSDGQAAAQGRTALLEAAPQSEDGYDAEVPAQRWDDGLDDNLPGQIVREKEHAAKPMTVDQALYEMELVGHDFYLFADADCGRPSVVYRRRGFDYGVIRLA